MAAIAVAAPPALFGMVNKLAKRGRVLKVAQQKATPCSQRTNRNRPASRQRTRDLHRLAQHSVQLVMLNELNTLSNARFSWIRHLSFSYLLAFAQLGA